MGGNHHFFLNLTDHQPPDFVKITQSLKVYFSRIKKINIVPIFKLDE